MTPCPQMSHFLIVAVYYPFRQFDTVPEGIPSETLLILILLETNLLFFYITHSDTYHL